MKTHGQLVELITELKKTKDLLKKIDLFYAEFVRGDLKTLGKTQSAALIAAGILENFYTCLETFFLRVSQFFENSLGKSKWHSELLRKMTLHIEDLREPVISDNTYMHLRELLRFRHFKRYYFEFDYDWDKLDFLLKKYEQLREDLAQDFTRFESFLRRLAESFPKDQ